MKIQLFGFTKQAITLAAFCSAVVLLLGISLVPGFFAQESFAATTCTQKENRIFDTMNLNYPGLEFVKQHLANDNCTEAKQALLDYMRNRNKPQYLFDHNAKKQLIEEYSRYFPADMNSDINSSRNELLLGSDRDWTEFGCTEKNATLNRMDMLEQIGRTYWQTDNKDYANLGINLMRNWISDNPVPNTPTANKCSPWRTLDTGTRTFNWVRAYQFLVDSPQLSGTENLKILGSLQEHAAYLYSNETENLNGEPRWKKTSNWLVHQCRGSAAAAIMFPEFKDSPKWRNTASLCLNHQLNQNTLDDGAYIELTPAYHMGVMRDFLEFSILADKNPEYAIQLNKDRYRLMFDWLAALNRPNGQSPALGDYRDIESQRKRTKEWLNIGAYYFNEPAFKFVANQDAHAELYWFFGKESIGAFQAIPKTKPSFTSIALADSQYLVMRDGWEETSNYLLFDAAPYASGHSHYDALNIIVDIGNTEALIDPGRVGYDDSIQFDYYRKAIAHNILLVDDLQDTTNEVHADPTLHTWETNGSFDFAAASYNIDSNTTHTRKVFYIKPDYWFVADFVGGTHTHAISMLYHFAPDTPVHIDQNQHIAQTNTIAIIPSSGLSVEEKLGWARDIQGNSVPAPYIAYSKDEELPASFLTALYPLDSKSLSFVSESLPTDSQNYVGTKLTANSATDYILVAKDAAAAAEGSMFGPITFTGEVAVIREDSKTNIQKVIMTNGENLQYTNLDITFTQQTGELTVNDTPAEYTFCHDAPIKKVVFAGKEISFAHEGNCVTFAPSLSSRLASGLISTLSSSSKSPYTTIVMFLVIAGAILAGGFFVFSRKM